MGFLFKLVMFFVVLNLAWTYYYKPNYVPTEKCPVCNGEGSILVQQNVTMPVYGGPGRLYGGTETKPVFSRAECKGCYGKKLLTLNEKKEVDERR